MFSDILRAIVEIVAGLAVPALSIMALRQCNVSLRKELPRWRIVLGLASIMITFSFWLVMLVRALTLVIGVRERSFAIVLDNITPFALVLGVSLSLLLKGKPRIQAASASLCMALFLLASSIP